MKFALFCLSMLMFQIQALAGDPVRGEVVAGVRCTPCHYLDRTTRMIGPGLLGVYGRSPSITGVPFKIWDQASLDRWLRNPTAIKPNTRMRIPPISARDRADIIAFLKIDRKKN